MSSPRGFGLPHLSEDAVAAFADGVLSAAAASRARRHCSECLECADAVRVQREAAMMLRAAQAPPLPSGLLDRLAGLPMSAPLPPPRGGLPTVLGADGVPMFVAHDPRNDEHAEQRGSGDEPAAPQQPQQSPRSAPRRGAVPVTVLASAAAVVAAGTFGGHVSTLAVDSNLQAPAGAANAAGALTSAPSASKRSGSLTGAGLLGAAFSTSPAAIEGVPAPRAGVLATSVSVAPVLRTGRRSNSPTANPAPSDAGPGTAGFWGATGSTAAGPTDASASTGSAPAPRLHGPVTATP